MAENNVEYIYIVLVKALTGLGKFARKISKYEYTHIAICLNEKLDDFITFSRRKHFAPFDSGFMHETLDCYAYGENDCVKLKVFKLPVSAQNKAKIEEYIKTVEEDNEYIFNIYSMATMKLFHGFRVYKAHNCMSFVSRIIELSCAINMEKKYYKYNIKDIDKLLSRYEYKEEYYYKTRIDSKDYMEKRSIISNMAAFFRLNGKLLYRIMFKNGSRNLDEEKKK